MKIIFISDIHGQNVLIPDGDILICTGDITRHGTSHNVFKFNEYMSTLPHKHKIVIAGNHDWFFEQSDRNTINRICTNFTYIQNELIEVEGVQIWGTPWTPKFFDWAFQYTGDEAASLIDNWLETIPKNLDILLTHGPPFGILDKTAKGEYAGCTEIKRLIDEIKPKVHAFGHIHEGYGMLEKNDTIFINSSIMTYRYKPINKPVELIWPL